ncbi:hypothetical protein C9374_006168 [Naegleria lovaniensis]|uniref:RING-type domain-containing protein n=1 Tax=Naegleria lovaniensis TaxID=51637 RepID=A0AA88KHH3_NAELO|nr:uncharacterized protein C9374_006168 [Naegleria lovaniensis]KAG2381784.1 hypothetical protein C9374_006168 [Naegleria lovaniensis]
MASSFMDLKTITALSIFLTTILIAHTANQYSQFYLIVVNLISSKLGKIILITDLILLIIYFGMGLVKIFFGSLRIYEQEIVWEKGYFALIETCLAMTIFREELSTRMLAMMMTSLFLKIFHWICELRVKHLESLPQTSNSTFARIYSCLLLLLSCDAYFASTLTMHYLKEGVTLRVLFLSDFLILSIIALCVSVRLCFHAYNLSKQDAEGNSEWESRDVSVFYLEITSELLQSMVYLSFFLVIMSKYGLPFHLLRNIYITIGNVRKKITDLINYRRAAYTLDQKFENATQSQLDEYDGVCVVCREDMITNTPQNPIKVLPCGHLFHSKCLRGCLERSQECPTCRRPIDVLLKEQEERRSTSTTTTRTSSGHGNSVNTSGSSSSNSSSSNSHSSTITPSIPTTTSSGHGGAGINIMTGNLDGTTTSMMTSPFLPSCLNHQELLNLMMSGYPSTIDNATSSLAINNEQVQQIMMTCM